MSNLSLEMRRDFDARFRLRQTELVRRLEAGDGSCKYQIRLADGCAIEAVRLVDSSGRRTACLSTQAGCAMGCVFCKTGSLGFARNLSAAEIVEQFLHIKADCGSRANIVFMGMGEPLLNLENLRPAIAVLSGSGGGAALPPKLSIIHYPSSIILHPSSFSQRRVTVSSCGIVKGIASLAEEGPAVRLAVSITAADEALRRRLMPVSAANPLAELKEALILYQGKRGKRITLEAVLLGGINTGNEDARAFKAFAEGLDVLVNLIPWNPVEGRSFEGKPLCAPSPAETARFAAALEKAGLKTVIRHSKGASLGGACGQLGRTGAIYFSW
jgi:23S rRNA (adenine2503-C2)-methyltransferase